jgi:hypothetical protein
VEARSVGDDLDFGLGAFLRVVVDYVFGVVERQIYRRRVIGADLNGDAMCADIRCGRGGGSQRRQRCHCAAENTQ